MNVCAILHGDGLGAPKDPDGCVLPIGHKGPHEFVAKDGRTYQWETDLECECECDCDGDWCTLYWEKK